LLFPGKSYCQHIRAYELSQNPFGKAITNAIKLIVNLIAISSESIIDELDIDRIVEFIVQTIDKFDAELKNAVVMFVLSVIRRSETCEEIFFDSRLMNGLVDALKVAEMEVAYL
jgi:hypothetical protein